MKYTRQKSNGTKRHMLLLPVFLVAVVAVILGAAVPGVWAQCEEFDEFEVFIEINATDLDAGLQGILDGEAWDGALVSNPDGEPIFSFEPDGTLGEHGVTEIKWESNEPPFHPSKEADPSYKLGDFLELFEEGPYTALGTTVEGDCLESEAELSHDLPAGPNVTSVTQGYDLTVTWDEVAKEFDPMDPQGQKQNASDLKSEIVGYIVVAEYTLVLNPGPDEEEITRVLTIDVAPDETSANIPESFLPDAPEEGDELEFKIEVGAVEETGNTTFTEIEYDLFPE